MSLARLEATAVRNLRSVKIAGLAATNIFYGDNGSGKTSLLESAYMLGMARSFRTANARTLINHEASSCTVYGEIVTHEQRRVPVGVSRDRDGSVEVRVAGEPARSTSELAELLPLQLINAESFNLLSGGPTHRRQYLDWGVFHVEHGFYNHWRRFQRSIKQRNSMLRHGKISLDELAPWDRELSEAGEQVDRQRRAYFELLVPAFANIMARLAPDMAAVELRYRRGWDKDTPLLESLRSMVRTDCEQGFTHAGPQRADIRLIQDGHHAGDILSRGQQKLAVCALKLAQGQVLAEHRGRRCVYLVDDLPAELDQKHCAQVAAMLNELQTQVFITCVAREEVAAIWAANDPDVAMFHVEQGAVSSDQH